MTKHLLATDFKFRYLHYGDIHFNMKQTAYGMLNLVGITGSLWICYEAKTQYLIFVEYSSETSV